MSDTERPLASPCVNICALDDDDVCSGCQRTVAEITRWSRMTNPERREVLALCHERAKSSGVVWMVGRYPVVADEVRGCDELRSRPFKALRALSQPAAAATKS